MSVAPRRARTAAVLFLVFGGLVLLNALVWQFGAPESRQIDVFRAAVRVLGVVLIAVGLFRGVRWGWLLGVVFGGFWLLMGVLTAIALVIAEPDSNGVSTNYLVFLVVAVAVLGTGWALLLTREVRHAYRNP
jgi:hypothetical protein